MLPTQLLVLALAPVGMRPHRHVTAANTPRSSKAQMLDSNGRRTLLSRVAALGAGAVGVGATPRVAKATITQESNWPLWPALPVFPYSRRKTIRREVGPGVWAFEQLIGIYYVHVPIRMTVIELESGGLLVYAPIAPTKECITLLQPLIDRCGPVQTIILPSVAVEHKVLAGPFARAFPNADFYAVDQQYSFPLPLPSLFLGLPPWTKPLPRSSRDAPDLWPNREIEHEVLTVKPGPGSYFQDVALLHKPSRTVLICDSLLAVTDDPPEILTSDPEYINALLFHARDEPLELVSDSPETRRKGWRRIVLLFNFFIPGATQADIGLGPLRRLDGRYPLGWGGWQPFTWFESETASFAAYSAGGKPGLLPIIQIILNRGVADGSLQRWLDVVTSWGFERVVPCHLDAPLKLGPREFAEPFKFAARGGNEMRYCDEDVSLLREAERGPLAFSVSRTTLGPLTGATCDLGKGEARVVSEQLKLRWTPK